MAQAQATKSKSKYSAAKKKEYLADYKLGWLSRNMSLIGRKEVLSGKAKFGIFGDGKEMPQIAMSKFFKDGDFRSGYYRDQTFMMAIGGLKPTEFFAQLYAHADDVADPHSGGRQMNSHFATRLLDEEGNWIEQTKSKNTSADMSPTAGQMPRLLGLAQASKVYRNVKELKDFTKFSNKGNEVAFGTIGDASTSEGIFWETINAAGVLQVPIVMSVWDDGYGISVAKKYQTTKESISDVLAGFQRTKDQAGWEIMIAKAWDYPGLIDTYKKAVDLARKEHVPVLIHVEEVTQPQGHSTSGSHERYKSEERLEWETEYCCLEQTKRWMLKEGIATEKKIAEIEAEAEKEANDARAAAWAAFMDPMKEEKALVLDLVNKLAEETGNAKLNEISRNLKNNASAIRRHILSAARKALVQVRESQSVNRDLLINWLAQQEEINKKRYNSHFLSESANSPMHVEEIKPTYDAEPKRVDGRLVLRDNFDVLFDRHPNTLVFGEDSGKLGGVNLGLDGMQDKYGETRVSDVGIREATILGQGIGMALRGLRPIAEIQYLDYLLYCFQTLSDDLATLRYRTAGGQTSPVIVRTRGHRLEGIWHSGSPMGMIVNGIRGIHVCVPRNLTTAAGFYNTLIQGDDPALVIEPLNGYRLKENLPNNLGDFTTPLGVPEVVQEGEDVTIVSYGSTFNIIQGLLPQFEEVGISVELIDVRTLLPFDINHSIVESLKKTCRIVFVDEDVPGGATAYMMQKVIQEQGGYNYLDSEPLCIAAKDHRPAYASDGDYFSKPSAEDIFEQVYALMMECQPNKFKSIY